MKMKKILTKDNFIQLVKFGSVGVLNTLVDAVVFTGCVYLFHAAAGVAQFFAYLAGLINSYAFNSRWTFQSGGNVKQAVKFFVLNSLTLIISVFLINYLVGIIHVDSVFGIAVGENGNKLIAKLPIMVVTTTINFIGSKLWVFKDAKAK